MKVFKNPESVINSSIIKEGSIIYTAGNAATPQVLLKQLVKDTSIKNIDLLSVLLLGDVGELFDYDVCERITHRVIFNGHHSREAMGDGRASYQLIHLSDIPRQLRENIQPNVVFLSVSGPDNGGNYSYGTTVEGVQAAVETARQKGGVIIAEKNIQMPFVLGTTLHESEIDYLIESNYEIPVSPVEEADERALKIGELITELYIHDGTTLQYGIGEVPEAVTDSIIKKGVKDLGIFTELFSDAMRRLVDAGVVTNKYLETRFSTASIILADSKESYQWYDYNSSIQTRPSDFTNSIVNIARQPKMTAINSAMGVDLHGNIWADSLKARKVYSGIGGQADFLRGSYLSEGGNPIIAMKSTTDKGQSKVANLCPEGITTTAIAADPVIIVTENGAFNPKGLNLAERAVGITHLAKPKFRDELLKQIYDSEAYHTPRVALKDISPKGFISYEEI
jgi:acyl-CoA hydrolase